MLFYSGVYGKRETAGATTALLYEKHSELPGTCETFLSFNLNLVARVFGGTDNGRGADSQSI